MRGFSKRGYDMKKRTLLMTVVSTAGLVSMYGVTALAASQPAAPAQPANVAEASEQVSMATPETKAATVNETPETGVTEVAADGPGGHQDATGTKVDHQFQGQE